MVRLRATLTGVTSGLGLLTPMMKTRGYRWCELPTESTSWWLEVVVALILYGLSSNGLLEVWHIGLASFISGLVWSTDFPVRRTLMSDLAGPSRVSRAMSLDILAGSVTRTLGPLLGGVLYQQSRHEHREETTTTLYRPDHATRRLRHRKT